jgi:iron complex outermembrane receptor protein
MKNLTFLILLLSFGLMFGQNDSLKNKKELNEVIIYKSRNKTGVGVGKAGITAMSLPQSTAVISKEDIEKQQILRLSDVVRNTNGIYVSGGSNASGNNQEELGSRGFVFGGGNIFKNGIRFNGSLIPETAAVESFEILKGSTALLYGNVAPGGVLNLVTKKPKFEQGGEVLFRTGSYDFYKTIADVYGPINESKTIAYRVISSFESAKSFRDVVSAERNYIDASVLYNLSNRTNFVFEFDYLKDRRTPDFGITTIDYKIADMPRNAFLNFVWANFDTKQQSFESTLNHKINEKWDLKSIFSYQGFDTDLLSSLRPNSTNLVAANGDWNRGVQKITTKQDYSIAEIDLTGVFKTGVVNHNFLLGMDADNTNTGTLTFNNISFFDRINIFNPTVVLAKNSAYAAAANPLMTINTAVQTAIKRAGFYAQDLIEINQKIKVLAGLRYSYLDNLTTTYTAATDKFFDAKTVDRVFSSKVGVVYLPTTNHSIFASYADSFVLNTGTDRFLNALPSSRIDQYEIGVKNELFKKRITANLTTYIIDNNNLAQTDFSNGNLNTNIKELAGAFRSSGIEIDVNGSYKGVKIMFGYSFNETKYTKSNIFDVGTALRFSPKHTANTSLFYDFKHKLKGLEIGLMSNYVSGRLGGRLRPNNAVTVAEKARRPIELDGFFQFDASIGYSIKSFSVRTKITNIANEISYFVYDDNTITPIAPRVFATTLTYKF